MALNSLAGQAIELAGLLTQWIFSHHLDDDLSPHCLRNLRVNLPTFDKFQVRIQFFLQHNEMFALVLISIEMITDGENHIACSCFSGHEVDLIDVLDSHDVNSWVA